MAWPTWQSAWHAALYGPEGFYRRPEGPAGHFRTAAHAAPDELAAALGRLAAEHGCAALVDVGAGRGELLTALAADAAPLRLYGVDVVGRPPGLPPEVGWSAGLSALPDDELAGALVVCWELLDVVPCPVLEVDGDGVPRNVHVEPSTGREALGAAAAEVDLAWRDRWWPGPSDEGDRIEIGRPRDELWAGLVRRTAAAAGGGVLLAVDYAHAAAARPPMGSLAGFRAGRQVPPRPDGSMDVTAHVALDAVAAAGAAAGARDTVLTTQREALQRLGTRNAELLDAGSLGGFGWLLQRVGER